MGGKNQFAMALQVSMSSMGFQGVCLSLEESDEDYAGLVPLLDQLPWEAGHINLGKTEEERIAEGTYTAAELVMELQHLEPQHLVMEPQHLVMERMTLEPQP